MFRCSNNTIRHRWLKWIHNIFVTVSQFVQTMQSAEYSVYLMVSNGFKILVSQRFRNCFAITKQLRCIYFTHISYAYCMHRFYAYGTIHDKFAEHIILLTHPQELLRHNNHYVVLRCLQLAFQQMWHHIILGNTQNRKPIATTKSSCMKQTHQ